FKAVNKLCLVADTCGQVPKLQNKAYSDYYLTSAEWTLLELMREVLQLAIEKGLAKLNKWYKAIDETDVYFICLALDPRFKLAYVKCNWDS
ncbi:hypothetical protein BYT27DRAFT_7108250, partial [Phlegmacium glaucopus]